MYIARFLAASYAYCIGRTVVYAPPLKDTEYVVDRLGQTLINIAMSPVCVPMYIYTDIKNIEHLARKMPGKINRFPW